MNFVISSEMSVYELLLQLSEEMEITWCEVRDVWWMFRTSALPLSIFVYQITTPVFVTLYLIRTHSKVVDEFPKDLF